MKVMIIAYIKIRTKEKEGEREGEGGEEGASPRVAPSARSRARGRAPSLDTPGLESQESTPTRKAALRS